MFVLSARRKKKELGKSEKPQTEFIRNNSYHCHSGNKKHTSMHAHTHAHARWHTPLSSQGRTHHTHLYSQNITAASKHTLTHTSTSSKFISSAAQQVFGCRSINIDSHFDSTYSFIYLLIHSLIHFTSKRCQLLRLSSVFY